MFTQFKSSIHRHVPQSRQILTSRIGSFQVRCALAGMLVAWSSYVYADPLILTLSGDAQTDLWGAGSLTAQANPNYGSFPGTGNWPGPIQSPTGGDAYLLKLSNGPGGGPFPSGSGIYYGGFDTGLNVSGGTLAVEDATPVAGVKTVAFQIQIGQAYGYDLKDNDPSKVTLVVTTDTGEVTLDSQSYAGVLNRFYNGSVPMPTGPGGAMEPQDIYVNLWGMQWDLSTITSNILSYQVRFTGVQHASLGQLQLDQSSTAYGLTSVFPGDFVWNSGGGNSNWTTTGNWTGGNAPGSGRNVRLTGNQVTVDATQTVGTLKLNGNHGFILGSTGGAVLETGTGITVTSPTPATHTISAPLKMNGFNLIDVAEHNTLVISGPITGAGFYKQGSGNFEATGNNTYDGTNSALAGNGLIIRGGINTFTGTNTITGSVNIGFNVRQDTTVILKGGDDRLDAKFQLNLLAGTSKMVLGDNSAASDQTVAGLTGEAGSQIVNGGSAETAVLTVNNSGSDNVFSGRLGGDGLNENNLALVKTGANSLTLSVSNTYNGGTTINAGTVVIPEDRALGTGSVILNGGTLRYGNAFNNLRAITLGSSGGTLDTQGFTVSYGHAITSGNRLSKMGVKGFLTLTGANTYSGGTTVLGGYLSVDSDARLGTAPASPVADHLNLNVGALHASETFTLNSNRGITLGNPANSAASNGAISVAPGKTLTYGGVIANANSANNGLLKTGDGTLVLTGDNSYSGTTGIHQGKILLDFSQSALSTDILHTSGTNSLQVFGADFEVRGKTTGTSSQAIAGTTSIAFGHSNIKVDSNGGSGTNLVLATLARSAGATVNFDLPAVGTVSTTTTTAIGGVITSAATNGVAYATVNGTDWASLSGNNIVALSSYQTGTTDTAWLSTDNVAPSGNVIGGTTRTINTLKLAGGVDLSLESGQTLTLTAGGILVTGSGASEIAGGTIRGANGTTVATRELVVFQNNTSDAFTISSVIANNTNPTAFTKSGPGTLVLANLNTYSGVTRITDGVLSVSALANGGVSSPLGLSSNGGANLVIDGGKLRYTGSGHSTDRLFSIGYQGGTIDASGTGPLNFSNGGNLVPIGSYYRTFTLTGTNTDDNNLSGVLPDAPSGALTLVKNGPGTWMLSPGSNAFGVNSFTGGLIINEGTIKLGRDGALNTAANRVTFGATNTPTLAVNGFVASVTGLSSSNANAIVENRSANAGSVTITASVEEVFAGTVRDGIGAGRLSIVKAGAGAQTFTGTTSYTGSTTVNQGVLNLNGTHTGGGAVTIADEARLNVNGSLVIGGETKINGTLAGSGSITFAADATLKGNGQVNFNLTVGGSAGQLETIAPGNSVGALTTQSQTWASGGSYLWEISDTDAGLGLGWDHLQIEGTLSLTADSGAPFTLQIASLLAAGTSGDVADFNPYASYQWTFATATGGILGFDPADFAIDTAGFTNDLAPGAQFSVIQDGTQLLVLYAVPEPSSALLLLGSGLWLAGLRRHRSNSRPQI